MNKTFLGDWSRNFLPITNQLTTLNLNGHIPLNNQVIYKESDFSVNELSINLGVVNFQLIDFYLNKCFSILKLISIILNKNNNIFESLYVTKETFLNKSNEEINDYVTLLENGFTEKMILERINILFNTKDSNFTGLFKEIFNVNNREDYFIVYMYFIGCFIEIYQLHSFMKKNKLSVINLATKTFSFTKLEENGYFISEIFLKGDNDNYLGCMHSYSLNLLEKKDFANSFNTFMLNERAKQKEFKLHDLSMYLNDSYFNIVDSINITNSEKQILKFLFNYIQFKVLKDSLAMQSEENKEG